MMDPFLDLFLILHEQDLELGTAVANVDGIMLPVLIFSYNDEPAVKAMITLLERKPTVAAIYSDGNNGRAQIAVQISTTMELAKLDTKVLSALAITAVDQEPAVVDDFLNLVHRLGYFCVMVAQNQHLLWETIQVASGYISDQRRSSVHPLH